MKKLIVLLSGNGTNLPSILEGCTNGSIQGRIVAVFSNKSTAYGLIRAHEVGIPVHVVSVSDFVSRDLFERQLVQKIDFYAPDLLILAGYMLVLSSEFVMHYHNCILNIHPSLLPKYPGLNTYRKALNNKDTEHGTTVHFVTAELDNGPIILQSRVPIFLKDTEAEIITRVQDKERIIYPLAISWFVEDRLKIHNGTVWLDNKIMLPTDYIY